MTLRLAQHEVIRLYHQGTRTVIYSGRRLADGVPVTIKAPRAIQPARAEVTRLLAEYEIGRSVDHPAVVRHWALEWDEHRPALVLEDFGGHALAEDLAKQRLALPTFLQVAVQLAEGLAALHAQHIIHKDINPSNVIYAAEQGLAKIADFSIATIIDRETFKSLPVEHLEGTLRYLSPEQTGRMNRSVDYRTDFYSLGATLFEMLCGRAPFDADDPMQLVHAHIARTPPSVEEFNPEVPQVVSAIIAKLLAKTPEERYQSAQGILVDLRRCRDELAADGQVQPFAVAQSDFSRRFSIPERLYGRSRAVDELLGSFERAAEGSRELLAIGGQAGVGKSALVHEVQRPLVERRGRFVSGKFDQLQRDVPHSGFIEALRELVQQLLTETEQGVTCWRQRLTEALACEAQVLTEVLPELATLIQEPPPATSLPAAEAERRFNRLMCRLLRVVASREHPLVIFLDDLQWADASSLHLIESLAADDELHHLLLITCYREAEVDATHPLTSTLKAVERGPAALSQITLGPLQPGHLAKMIADTLRCEPERVQPLAELVHRKTLGNPFFVGQFLTSLYYEGLLTFDEQQQRWTWEADRIEAHGIPDDVAALLVERVDKLAEDTRRVLELAACIGVRFDLGTLSIIAEKAVGEVARALQPAVERGVVRVPDGSFGRLLAGQSAQGCSPEHGMAVACAFAHNRVRQAVYSRIPDAQRKPLRLRLGRLLHDHLGPGRLHERLFEVVHHYVAGMELLTDPAERLQVARLNHTAGLKAMASAAHDAARMHFDNAIDLLPQDRWERHYELTFDLHLQLVQCLVPLPARDRDLQALCGEMLQRAATAVDRRKALAFYIIALARDGEPERAIDMALQELRSCGIELRPPDVDSASREGYHDLRERLGDRPISDLAELPLMTAEEHLATMELMRTTMLPLYMRARELVPLAEMATIRISMEHGNGPLSGIAYSSYARVVAHVFGDFASAYEAARVGCKVADAMGVFRSGAHGLSAATVDWLRDPAMQAVCRLREAFRLGLETVEPIYPGLCALFLPQLAFSAGVLLESLYEECQSLERYTADSTRDIGTREVHLTLRTIEALRGQRPWRTALFADEQQAQAALDVMRIRNPEGAVWYHLQACRLAFLFGEPALALEMVRRSDAYADRSMGFFAGYDLVFHEGLALAATIQTSDPDPAALGELEQLADTIKGWVDAGAGANFGHKHLLLRAELARLRSDTQVAAPTYEQAIAGAGKAGFIQDQALANELAAGFFLGRGLDKVARVYLNDARYGYEKWGASAKVADLSRRYPGLAEATAEHPVVHPSTHQTTQSADGTTSTSTQWLDFTTVIKASRAISGEIVLDDLLRTLLSIIAENAGAERAFLLLRRDGDLTLEAASEAESSQVQLVGGKPLARVDTLSGGIVRYVARTQQNVVLEDASREGRFRADPYVGRARPKSVLCAPLTTQGKLVGVIYLENNLVRGAFSAQRLEAVDVLCAQAAISIEQARLVSELESTNRQLADHSQTLELEVARRTQDLADKNQQLAHSLARLHELQGALVISEKMASLGNLVAGVAHEINTPVGAIVSSADTARRAVAQLRELQPEDPQQGRRMGRLIGVLDDNTQVVASAGERVSEIVLTLRRFARLDEAERKSADLHEGLDETLTLVRHRLKGAIEVTKDYGDLPPVHCHLSQINQVFMNLLTNAIDAIEQRAGRGTIRLRTWLAAGKAHVQVSDDGQGIPPEGLARVFDPGYTTKGVGVGTGLGLSICFNIIREHDGTIEVQSAPSEGSVFTMALPVLRPSGG